MNNTAFGDGLCSYHIEAAISFEHCMALKFEDNIRKQIRSHYDILEQIHPTPFVALNHMTVVLKISDLPKPRNNCNKLHY